LIRPATTSLWPSVEDVVPPELPPIENRELREALDLARLRPPAALLEALKPRHDRSDDVL
jgi:hypothetical protein